MKAKAEQPRAKCIQETRRLKEYSSAVREGMKTNVPVAILVRVSTSKQENARQLTELTQYADSKGYSIIEVCKETISGNADADERHGLRRVEELAETGKIKKVLAHEISRIARRNSVAHRFVEKLEQCGVSLYWHAQSVETLLPNGKRNPAAGIMLALLAEMARSELEVLRARIVSGLAEARRAGKTLGRPVGSVLTAAKFLHKHRDVVRLLKAGQSIRNAAKLTDKGVSTVQRVCVLRYHATAEATRL
jgi:DNA invertase Pin-like site-specific DNA recombinase